MKRIFDLGFRNKLCKFLLLIMALIFLIGVYYSNIVLAYIFVISWGLLLFLLAFPFDNIRKFKK